MSKPTEQDLLSLAPGDEPIQEVEEESDVEHFHWRVTKNLTRRIDQYLVDRVGYLSRNGVQRLIDNGLVKVNGRWLFTKRRIYNEGRAEWAHKGSNPAW